MYKHIYIYILNVCMYKALAAGPRAARAAPQTNTTTNLSLSLYIYIYV